MVGATGVLSGHVVWADVAGRLSTGDVALGADALLAAAGIAYLLGTRRARRSVDAPGADERGARWREACFLAGLVTLFVAFGSGLAASVDVDPVANVVQHVLLMMVAPPLLVLGRPLRILRALVTARARRPRMPAGGPGRVGAAVRWLSGAVSWPLYYGSMGAYFLTPLYADAVRDRVVLHAVQAAFVGLGLLFWSGLVGEDRRGVRRGFGFRIAAVVAGMPVETAVGLSLVLWPRPLAGAGLATTHAAGLALWLGSMASSGVALAALLVRWAVEDSGAHRDPHELIDPVAPGAGLPVSPLSAGRGDGRWRP